MQWKTSSMPTRSTKLVPKISLYIFPHQNKDHYFMLWSEGIIIYSFYFQIFVRLIFVYNFNYSFFCKLSIVSSAVAGYLLEEDLDLNRMLGRRHSVDLSRQRATTKKVKPWRKQCLGLQFIAPQTRELKTGRYAELAQLASRWINHPSTQKVTQSEFYHRPTLFDV